MPAPGKLQQFAGYLRDLATRRSSGVAALVVVASVALSGRHEISRIVSDVSVAGRTFPAAVLSSPLRVLKAADALTAWQVAGDTKVQVWLVAYLVVQVVLVASVGGLVALANRRWHFFGGSALRWLSGLWSAQLLVAFLAVFHQSLWWVLVATTLVAWVATILAAVKVALAVRRDEGRWLRLKRVGRALGMQRFQLVIVGLLAVLFVVPGPPILEQGVDVLRSWLVDEWNLPAALWGVASFALLWLTLLYLAGVRAAPEEEPGPLEPPQLGKEWKSTGMVLAVLVVAYVVVRLLPFTRVDGWLALMTAVVVVGVPAAGALTSWLHPEAFRRPVERTAVDIRRDRRMALMVGRLLAVAVPVILLVAMCRSLFAPTLLSSGREWWIGLRIVPCALAAMVILAEALRRPAPDPRAEPRVTRRASRWRATLDPQMVGARRTSAASVAPNLWKSVFPSALLTVATALPLLIVPLRTARLLGLVGTVGLCLTMLTAFFMAMMIVSQNVDTPYLFRQFRMTRTPAFELVLVVALLGVVFVKDTGIHAARWQDVPAPVRLSLAESYENWEAAAAADDWGCALALANPGEEMPTRVQPLVMVAAEGGGIRAAWWTIDAMTKVASTECGAASVFLASGVSGGAVGLGVMSATWGDKARTAPLDAAEKMAAQDALAAGVSGLLGRDLIAGAFGLEVDPMDAADEIDQFPDRAGLIEMAWERHVPELADGFPRVDRSVPWNTVFNGTSVGYDCRVLIADVQLIADKEVNDCDTAGNQVPGAYDLLMKHECYAGLPTSTASLLAARFPYVTPSGVFLDDCTGSFADQSIDGGYAENTGIDTANAALAQLMPLIREHNAVALQQGAEGVLIVPVVMYLHNTVAVSAAAEPEDLDPSAEAAIPLLNSGAEASAVKPEKLIAQSAVIAGQWMPEGTAEVATEIAQLKKAVDTALPSQVMTVAPQQKPQMALPLGWSMSLVTQGTLDNAMNDFLHCAARTKEEALASKDPTCPAAYAFDKLLEAWGTDMWFTR